MGLARTLVAQSPDALAGIKQLFDRNWMSSQRQALTLERKVQLRMLASANHRETIKAHGEKRPPRFKPRRFGG